MREIAKLLQDPNFRKAAAETAERAGLGFALSVMIGTVAGVAAGYSFAAMRLMRPIVTVILGVPPIAWIVLALIWFGASGGTAIMTVVVASLPISFVGGLEGAATRDRALDSMARSFGAGPWMRLRTVTLVE